MMDFLRRLAPARATDATRAVAVLPSRFASESPLRATIAQPGSVPRLDEDETPLSFDPAEPSAESNSLAAQRHPVTGYQPSHVAARPPASGFTHRDSGTVTSSPAAAELPDIDDADSRALPMLQGVVPNRTRPADLELQDLAAPLAASPGLQSVTAPPTPARVTSPLSQAALAQRTLQSQDDSQVVHVSIGRIDVVASTAPVPVARRNPTPREASVTLADYLRAGNGGRR